MWRRVREIFKARRQPRAPTKPEAGRATPPDRETLPFTEEEIVALVGEPIQNITLYEQAMRHRSLMRGDPESRIESNERLEYLGDAVLGYIVADALFRMFPDEDEGYLTRLRAKLVSGTALAASAREIALHVHLQTAGSITDAQTRASDSMLSDAFEALIGAIHLDLGLEAATRFVERHVLHTRDLTALARQRVNHKSELLETIQAERQTQPEYRVISESGPSHAKEFEVAVFIDGREYGRASDTSKKRAEQAAAAIALTHFKQT